MNRPGACFEFAVCLAITFGLLALPAKAQTDYPNRPIRLVVPFAPGGNTDVSSRLLAERLSRALGTNFVVDNRPGADGAVGSAEVARAKPDGYTLLVGSSGSHAINPLSRKTPAFDPEKAFSPIAVFGTVPTVIAVHPIVANSMKQLVERVRARPGVYSYSHSGTGGIANLSGELFKAKNGGLDLVPIPYKGGGPAMRDLIGGQVPVSVATLTSGLPFHRSGQLRILALFSEKRARPAPDIPTAIEQGLPGMVAYTFTIFLAPANTSELIIDRLSKATLPILADTVFQEALERAGVVPVSESTPQQAARFLSDEIAKWTPLMKAIGMWRAH